LGGKRGQQPFSARIGIIARVPKPGTDHQPKYAGDLLGGDSADQGDGSR